MSEKTRDAARTREQLLDSAARIVSTVGVGASLEAIAVDAGVSKGGLLHHFPTKDSLYLALNEHLIKTFRGAVTGALDESDTRPGRLVRAYVRVMLDSRYLQRHALEYATIMTALGSLPSVAERSQADARQWLEEFDADGLDPARSSLITRAAEGMSYACVFEGHSDQAEIATLESTLLALSELTGPPV